MELPQPGLSVLIPHYGDPAPTIALCEDLLRQDYAGPLQVVVIDDRSPQPMPEVADVTVLRQARNRGFSAAVNAGAAVATEDLLLILNSDISVPAGFLADLVLRAAPFQSALVAPQVRTDGGIEITERSFPRARHHHVIAIAPLHRFRHRRAWQRAVGLHPSALGREVAVVDWVAGVAMLLPRAAFEGVGGFDERFFMYAEEVDLQARLGAAGVPSLLVSEPVVDHIGGGSSDPARTRSWLLESRLRYADKWGGGTRLRLGLLAVAGVNLGYAAVRLLAGRPHDGADYAADVRLIVTSPWRYPPFRAE